MSEYNQHQIGAAVGEGPQDQSTPDPIPAFPRAPGETPRAYRAFRAYFELDQVRSLQAVADKLDEKLGTVKNWSSRFEWAERIQAFNAGLLQQHAAARQREAVEWSKRLEELRELEWDAAQKLSAAARCYLDAFGDDELRRMTLAQVSRALRIASTLARSALVGAELPVSADPQTTPLQQQLLNAVKCLYGQPPSPSGPPRPSDGRNARPRFGWREATGEGCTKNPTPSPAQESPSRGSAAGEGRTENSVLSQGGRPQGPPAGAGEGDRRSGEGRGAETNHCGHVPRPGSTAPSPSRGSAAGEGRTENPTPSPGGPPQGAGDAPRSGSAVPLPSRGSALKTQNSKFKTDL